MPLWAQRDFSAGQIDETALRADDTQMMRAGLRRARNVRIANTRSLKRRPGRRAVLRTTGIAEIVRPASGEEWFMVIEPGRVVFVRSDLSLTAAFDGLPWGADILPEISWVEEGGTVLMAHRSFRVQAFGYDRLTRTWSHFPFGFATEPGGATREPFHNFFLGTGVTLTPSAREGAISVAASGAVFDPGHVGGRVRYGERQISITGYVSPTQVNGTVVEKLPPSFRVTVDNVAGLQVGDVIEGVSSGAKGQVVVVGATTFDVLLTRNWAGFTTDEYIAGPRSRMKFTSQAEIASLASTVWDEQLISAYRGYPGTVSKDQRRVVFCNFLQAGPAVVWSATGTVNDFKVGADKSDAIFELLPENCTVLDVVGGADEFIFTDRGVYYVPISTANPLIPGSIEFRLITDDPVAPVRPQQTPDGLVFINAARTRVLALIGTGQSARPYVVDDISEYHLDVLNDVRRIAVTNTAVAAPERYLYACNADGTLAVGRVQRQQGGKGWLGWLPWDGAGLVKWVCAASSTICVTVEYETPGGLVRFVELFDDALLLDCSTALTTASGGEALEVEPGVPLEVSAGEPLHLGLQYAFGWAAGLAISAEQSGWYRGDYEVAPDGSLVSPLAVGDVFAVNGGFNFKVEVEPFVPHADEGELSRRQRLRRRRLKQVAATVLHTQAIVVAGHLVPYYLGGENEEQAPPLRSTTYRARVLGRDFDPRWTVEQTLPGKLTLIELTADVTL